MKSNNKNCVKLNEINLKKFKVEFRKKIRLLTIVCVLKLVKGYDYDEDDIHSIVKRQTNYYNNYDYYGGTTTVATTKKKLIKKCPTNAAGKRIKCKKKKKKTTTTTTPEPEGIPASFQRTGPFGIKPISFFLGPGNFLDPPPKNAISSTAPTTTTPITTTSIIRDTTISTIRLGSNALAIPMLTVSGSVVDSTTPLSLIKILTNISTAGPTSKIGNLVATDAATGLPINMGFFTPINITSNSTTTAKPAGLLNVTNSISNISTTTSVPNVTNGTANLGSLLSRIGPVLIPAINLLGGTTIPPTTFSLTTSTILGPVVGRIGLPVGNGMIFSNTTTALASASSTTTTSTSKGTTNLPNLTTTSISSVQTVLTSTTTSKTTVSTPSQSIGTPTAVKPGILQPPLSVMLPAITNPLNAMTSTTKTISITFTTSTQQPTTTITKANNTTTTTLKGITTTIGSSANATSISNSTTKKSSRTTKKKGKKNRKLKKKKKKKKQQSRKTTKKAGNVILSTKPGI